MEANSEAIVRLCWARALGLPDDALAAPGSQIVVATPDSAPLRILSLFDSSAIVGPAWMVEQIADRVGPSLATGEWDLAAALSALGVGAREMAREVLSYRDEYALPTASAEDEDEGPLVSHDPGDLETLLSRCAVDDVNDADLRGLDIAFTMLDDHEHRPLAAAAYRIEHGLLADVRTLTHPDHRSQGHAVLLAELALEDALDAGLIAQGRHHPASVAGGRLASALGFTTAGSIVVLAAGASD
ncbi:GNAT family N-acetyltransferase [Tomitella biformata]|uniref:GNAT family N-acetyltransferase n=1 Tax=Tomitella biformata TaxID=630403 RepID=UPI0004ACE187|nr:hypothetical protein [Tomitella biformata]